jgi:hypothetical protein
VRGHHRQALERLPAVAVEPAQAGEHRVLDACRNLVARRGERLGYEERVPARERMDGGGVAARADRERLHRAARQRRQLDPMHRASGERAEEAVQRVARVELVAHREDEDSARRLDAARRIAEHVEGGVVGPVDVLDDEDGRTFLGELVEHRGKDAIDGSLPGQRGGQRTVAARGRVVQGPERARRHEVVACRHEDPRLAADALDQGAYQARLADPRLAGDQRRRTAPLPTLGHRADEDLELRISLE